MVDSLLYAGSNLGRAQQIFAAASKAPATHPYAHPATDAGVAEVAAKSWIRFWCHLLGGAGSRLRRIGELR